MPKYKCSRWHVAFCIVLGFFLFLNPETREVNLKIAVVVTFSGRSASGYGAGCGADSMQKFKLAFILTSFHKGQNYDL